MTTVALATCAEFPDLEPPERAVIAPLASRGIRAVPVVWDDTTIDYGAFDLVVLRNTWDYVGRRQEFLDWVSATNRRVPVANDPSLVEWNTDKRYLHDLRSQGIAIVPTTFVSPGGHIVLPEADQVVVKPSVSVGSQDTGRYDLAQGSDAATAHVRRLLDAGRTVMIQPYISSVDDVGETALLYFDGTFSHAIRKGALLREEGVQELDGLFLQEQIRPRTPRPDELAVGADVIAQVARRGAPLYARVDLLQIDDGPVVLEVELTEPSLFLNADEGAPERFADAIARRCGG